MSTQLAIDFDNVGSGQPVILVEKPDYRLNGKYQFIKGWTGGGAAMCLHLTKEEIIERLTTILGPGELVDDGEDLWWKLNQ